MYGFRPTRIKLKYTASTNYLSLTVKNVQMTNDFSNL